MADDPFYANLDPSAAPDPVTPSDSPPLRPPIPGDSWTGTAPYDIAAPQDIQGIAAAANAAGALTDGGICYGVGPRQTETRDGILGTPQGIGAENVLAGFPDYESADIRPGTELDDAPIQGEMTYPVSNTYQEGIPMFNGRLGAGVEGVPPEGGSMGDRPGAYPGTGQSGLPTYGT